MFILNSNELEGIGTHLTNFERAYAFHRENIKIKDDWLEMHFRSGPFSGAVIYYDSTNPSPTVTHMLFFFNVDEGFKVVLNEALKVFGTATLMSTNRDEIEEWEWNNINGTKVSIDSGNYHVEVP